MPSCVSRERSKRDGETEVAELGSPVGTEPHVAGLEVAMDHVLRMSVGKGEADVFGDAQGLVDGNGRTAVRPYIGTRLDACFALLTLDVGFWTLDRSAQQIIDTPTRHELADDEDF